MAQVTEIATLPIPPSTSIEDPDSEAGKIWTSHLETIAQQEGYQRLYYGREIENPNLVQLVIDWDSRQAHQRFQESSVYGPFLQHFIPLLDGPGVIQHASFKPHPPSKAIGKSSAPVTEVLMAYLDNKDESYAERSAKFGSIVESNAEGCKGVSTGWILEEVEHENLGQGKKGNAYISVLGWESKEKHAAFRETSTFKDNIHMCREGCKGLSVNHTSFMEK